VAKELVVIGGGAAGFFCAVNAARCSPQLRVTILEKTGKLLSKVRISGGGRCNLTHALFEIPELSRRYPRGQHFVKKTFHRFSTTDTIAWFEERGVPVKREGDGRMFPASDSSESIIGCLLREANRYGVEIRMHAEVKKLEPAEDRFLLHLSSGQELAADYVCVATGGYPKASQFQWLQALGHTVTEPVPSLFTFNLPGHPLTALMGVSVAKARVKVEGTKLAEEGPLLITHWGLSGPAVLRLSAWGARELSDRQYRCRVHVSWLPGETDQSLKAFFGSARQLHPTRKLVNAAPDELPQRLWQFLLEQAAIPAETRLADLPAKGENRLIQLLTDFVVEASGKTTYKDEFVTAGGILLGEVDPNTLMSRKVPNLYFAGEVLDVDGITGGFNFQHAWASGFIVAQTIAAAEGEKA
jgi:predicted Rossmann fold flavoprotein